jgi:hypothetical protein
MENQVDSEIEEDSDHTIELEATSESPGHTAFFSLNAEDQRKIVLDYLKMNSKNGILDFTSKNNTRCMWVRFSCSRTSISTGSSAEPAFGDYWRHFNNM